MNTHAQEPTSGMNARCNLPDPMLLVYILPPPLLLHAAAVLWLLLRCCFWPAAAAAVLHLLACCCTAMLLLQHCSAVHALLPPAQATCKLAVFIATLAGILQHVRRFYVLAQKGSNFFVFFHVLVCFVASFMSSMHRGIM